MRISPISTGDCDLGRRRAGLVISSVHRMANPRVLGRTKLSHNRLSLLAKYPPYRTFSALHAHQQGRGGRSPDGRLVVRVLQLIHSVQPHTIVMRGIPKLTDSGRFSAFYLNLGGTKCSFACSVLGTSGFNMPREHGQLVLITLEREGVPFT